LYPLPSSRQYLSNDDSMENKEGRLSELFCGVVCATVVHSDIHTYMISSYSFTGLLFVCFCHFVLVLFAFVVFVLVSSVLSQKIG